MTKIKKKSGRGWPAKLTFLALVGLCILIAILLRGKDVVLLNPMGLIAQEQMNLMLYTVAVLLVIAVPTLIILYHFAWKYRETNEKAIYSPNFKHGKLFVFSMWAVPSAFMLVLAAAMWPATHRLQPQKPIAGSANTLTIQVIAIRWKWLFIYPEQNIASVNFVQVPVNTPVQFELTADEAPMSSFWIPHLGGQLYAMTGHRNGLNLMAETVGDYPGRSAEINGAGFEGMKFTARASSSEDFEKWVEDIRQSPDTLNESTYESLLKPSQNNSAVYYSAADSDIYDKVLMKYYGPAGEHSDTDNEGSSH